MNYCGVKRPTRATPSVVETTSKSVLENLFNRVDEQFDFLGTRIIRGAQTGESLGSSVTPMYDSEEETRADILASACHDMMDIAEEFGSVQEPTGNTANIEVNNQATE